MEIYYPLYNRMQLLIMNTHIMYMVHVCLGYSTNQFSRNQLSNVCITVVSCTGEEDQ